MKKQITLLDLLTHNDHLKEEEQLILNDMIDYLIENHCRPNSKTETQLQDVDYYLTHPWIKVETKEKPEAFQHLIWTEEAEVRYQGESNEDIQLIKKALLNYTLTINPEIPTKERWNIFADLIQEARENKTVKEDLTTIRFGESETAKRLNASSVFKVGEGKYRFYGLIEAVGQVEGKKRYNLHLLTPRFNQPVVFYVKEGDNKRFIEKPDTFQTFEIEDSKCLVEFLQRLFERF